jgi:hypothetical protein
MSVGEIETAARKAAFLSEASTPEIEVINLLTGGAPRLASLPSGTMRKEQLCQ